jgi:hypothetical protein
MSEILIDNQVLTDYCCPRYGYYRHIRNWTPKSEGPALGFGLAIHAGLHALHDTHDLVTAGVAFETSFEGKGDDLRTFEKGVEILEEYDRRFSDEPWRDLVEGGEVKGSIPIHEDKELAITYVVRIDRPGWLDNELWFKEWKTSSRPSGFIVKPNQQITGYCWAMRSLFDQPVIGALVELLGVFKSSKDGKRQVGYGKDKSTVSIIERVPVVIADWEVGEFVEDVVSKTEEILAYRAANYWPKKTSFCGMWSGCPYIPLCTTPVSQWDMIVESTYEERPWTPGGVD